MTFRFPLPLRHTALILFVATIALPNMAQSQILQNRTRIVLRTGYDTERDAAGLGGAVRIPLGRAVELIPSLDWFFVDLGDDWQGNLDVAYRFGGRQLFYLGGGLGVINRRTNNVWASRGGLNIFGGLAVETPGGRFGLLVEPRFTLIDDSASVFWLTLGASYAFGK